MGWHHIGVAIFGKYLPQSPSRNTALCYYVGASLNLMRHWEHITQITQKANQLYHEHLCSESQVGVSCAFSNSPVL